MIYYLYRPIVNLILRFIIKRTEVTGLENIPKTGAVLLASNHPNSFFDALMICCALDRRVWSLARGDAFKKPIAKKLLMSMFMMPIYRISEGKENMGENDDTFKKCGELFDKKEIVLIFSEGICTNQTELLPLKKGTARLMQKEWLAGKEISVVPIGLMYDSFDKLSKRATINIGKPIQKSDFQEVTNDGFFIRSFNEILMGKLINLISTDFKEGNFLKNPLYYIGWVINFPMYYFFKTIAQKKTKGTVFFDSINAGLLVLFLPIYWILTGLILKCIF